MILHGFAIKIIFIKGIKISECDIKFIAGPLVIIIISFYPYNYENIKDIFWKSKLGEIRGVFISILTMIYIIYNYKLQFVCHLTILSV